jgi:GEVED domain/Secretion system C-terminal sorting domain
MITVLLSKIQAMKKLFTSILLPKMLFAFALFSFLSFNRVAAQCPGGYTQSQLNWDNLDFLPTTDPTYYTPYYVSGITPYNQNFTIGTRRVNFAMSPAANITLDGENAINTADAGSFATPGQDVQFTTTASGNTTITIAFDADVANVKFSLFDIDAKQVVTIGAGNTALVPQVVTVTKANAGSGIVIAGSPGITPSASALAGNLADNDNNGTINVSIAGPVKTIVILLNSAVGDIWLSDIDACVTGGFPNNWRNISRPFTGMPAYILTVRNNEFYLLDPATGRAKPFFTDPGHTNMNGMAYDPYQRMLYYTYSLTSSPVNTKSIYKYDVDNETISTFVADVNAAPLNIPTYTPGVTSGSASFYNGSYYFGVEAGQTVSGNRVETKRENTVWKIDFAADSITPIRASQVYATRVDSNVAGTDVLIHDWSDIGVTNNGMLYDFDGARGDSMYYHFNLMTGQRTEFLPNGAGIIGPKQLAIDWQENVYNMGGLPGSSAAVLNIGGFIVPYNYNGTVNNAQNYLVYTNPGPVYPTGSWGDCSEAYRPNCDFGDAPASYDPNPLSPAVHEKDTAIRIGATWDREWLKTSSALANADGADEDGLAFVPIFSPIAGTYLAQVSVYNNTGGNATLIAWLDMNGNGLFDAGEACQTPPVVTSMASMQNRYLYWPSAPTSLPYGSYTYLRIRLVRASAGMTNSNPTGYYDHGETEDYHVLVDSYPLKADLLSFNAKIAADNTVELKWNSSGEENFAGYEIQRSADNNNWIILDMVNAKGNGLPGENSYTYNDLSPLKGKSFYRLKLISGDGKHGYSDVKSIAIQKSIQQITISPNPATDKAALLINASSNTTVSVTVKDVSGRTIDKQIIQVREGVNTVQLPITERLTGGVYFVLVGIKDELFTKKLIIRK